MLVLIWLAQSAFLLHINFLFAHAKSSAQLTLTSSECANPPRDQCSFYADCLEQKYHCGPLGYPIDYGQKYCEKFSTQRNKFSEKGQKWMVDTMQCLQRELVPEATGKGGGEMVETCRALTDKAFSTHSLCYVSSGVCKLPPSDWLAIIEIVDITTLFESWDAMKATFETAVDCLEYFSFLLIHIGCRIGTIRITNSTHCLCG